MSAPHSSRKSFKAVVWAMWVSPNLCLEKIMFRAHVPFVNSLQGLGNNLIVVVRQYKPNVTCGLEYSAPPPVGSCTRPIALVPVSTERKLFGRRKRSSDVQEPLPRAFRAGQCPLKTRKEEHLLTGRTVVKSNCAVRFDTLDQKAYGRWFDLWQGAVAVETMCVGQRTAGLAFRLGRTIFMWFSNAELLLLWVDQAITNVYV